MISGSFVNAPIGLNRPVFLLWKFNNLVAWDLVNVFPPFNAFSTSFKFLGNFATLTFSKTKICGLLDLKVTSPLNTSKSDASFCFVPSLEGLNLPFGSAKKERSKIGTSF